MSRLILLEKAADEALPNCHTRAEESQQPPSQEQEAQERVEELRAALQEARAANARLTEAVAARDAFIAVAGHELRNPMGPVILGITSLIFRARAGDLPDWVLPRIEALDRQLRRFVRRATTLLDVSRLATGNQRMEPNLVSLTDLVAEVLVDVAPEAQRAGCELRSEAEANVVGWWDQVALEQVAFNLVSNAVKYGAGRPIVVRVYQTEDAATLEVRDHGGGIARADQERIFEPFERAVVRGAQRGYGLGLWIARQLLTSHGGRNLRDERAGGVGSVFTARLPRGIHEPQAPEMTTATSCPGSAGSRAASQVSITDRKWNPFRRRLRGRRLHPGGDARRGQDHPRQPDPLPPRQRGRARHPSRCSPSRTRGCCSTCRTWRSSRPARSPTASRTSAASARSKRAVCAACSTSSVRRCGPRRATLVVLDGFAAVGETAESTRDFKKFVHELQVNAGLSSCTFFLLSSGGVREGVESFQPVHTMVDGLVRLSDRVIGLRAQREILVSKLRGSLTLRGVHTFEISDEGIRVFPRLESLPAEARGPRGGERVSTGVARLDDMVGGGLLRGSTTMILGPTGVGKTILGYRFLAGSSGDDRGLLFSFYESPALAVTKADGIGLDLQRLREGGEIDMIWQSPVEGSLDAIGDRLISAIDRMGARRLVLDGFEGFEYAANHIERVPQFFAALQRELHARGVTSIYTSELRQIFSPVIKAPVRGLSPLLENLLLLRFVELHGDIRRVLSVVKMRDSGFDHALREFVVSPHGIDIGDDFRHAEAILTGVAHEPHRKQAPAAGKAKKARKRAKTAKRRMG